MLFKPLRDDPPPMPPAGAPGTTGWHELHAMDGVAVWDFYATLFGWGKGEPMDMGPAGIYQILEIDGVPAGGVMTKDPGETAPNWRYYFQVDAIDAAVQRLGAAGGAVTMGPHQVPGGSWIVHGRDPQGASFALVSMAK
jgi:predicted enzyme related to lactoylglutathione lyase